MELSNTTIVISYYLLVPKYWQDKLTDGDRKRRRQAEFLVHRFFPLHLVDEIGVFSELTKTSVEQSVLRSGHQLVVNIRKDWYY